MLGHLCDTVRLINSGLEREGILQVYVKGQWASVSSYRFGHSDASVACHMLGFG